MKCRRGAARNAPTPGHRVTGKLRQGLAAETRAAGAEKDDVGRARAQLARGLADAGKIVALGRQLQQPQAAIGMARAQPVERGAAALQRIAESALRIRPCWPTRS